MRPLDRISSIKLKLGALVVVAVAITVVVFWGGIKLGVWPSVSGVLAGVIALVLARILARGLTSPLRDMSGAAAAMARGDYDQRVDVNSRDEIGQLAAAFNEMAAQLAETDRVRRDLVANTSHELRTPIAALRAQLENLVDGVSDPDPKMFTAMLAQADRLGRLVTQLLDLSRLEAGVVPLDRAAFDVGGVVQQAVREQELHDDAIDLRVDVEDGLVADGDPERMHQVVANLLENAARYTPSGGTVEVHARRARHGVTIEISDQGPGISDADAARVFERFYRADSARARSDGGAGLGLAIARWIVDLHGGDIHPERREPHGCRMVVTLPMSRGA